MQEQEFVHLHIHSEYSILDGSIKVKKLLKELLKKGFKAAALTDHDAMHGALDYYLEAQKEKFNGIIGYEANILYSTIIESNKLIKKNAHLTLLAENNEGYKNLIKLCSIANTVQKNLYGEDTNILNLLDLQKYGKGIICLTGCLKGEIPTLLSMNKEHLAVEYLAKLKSFYGENNVYIEIMDNGLETQKILLPLLIKFAEKTSTPLVATGDVHYLHKDDVENHLSLLAIKHKYKQEDVTRINLNFDFHLSSIEEMYEKFAKYPEALSNTKIIADRCKINIDTKTIYMPDYRQKQDENADDCLIRLSKEGLKFRKKEIIHWQKENFNDKVWNIYQERLEYELSIIVKMKFSGYFLIVQDFINWAKNNNIPVGPGRGSAAGSLVTYAIKITNIDPIRFNLLFERFLNPERISMPDIDTDFCQDRRNEVLDYVYKKYGERAVAQIVTFGKMKAKNAIKNLARIRGWSFTESNNFAKLIPEGPEITLEEAKKDEILKLRLENDEKAYNLMEGAIKIEGILANTGVHAAGVIISDRAIDENCPLMEVEGMLLTQYEYKYAEKIGLIKFDFLGLKTLTVVQKTVELIRKNFDKNFDIDTIDIEDAKVYEMLSTGHATGVFQLESAGMRKLLVELKPSTFSDIIALIALFRPGPLGSGMVTEFVERKHGKKEVIYPFPELEPVLKDTYGVVVYQEQVQKIAAVLANYSLGEADLLRRAMGKKDKLEMEKQKARFVSGAAQNNHDEIKTSELFDLVAKFAEYGFNKSHSAAYGYVTYQTAYLKTYYPTEFMTAIMSCDAGNTDKLVSYIRDCLRMNISVLAPSVNESFINFSIPENKIIRYGFNGIKDLGESLAKQIVAERKNTKFNSVPEFIAKVGTKNIDKKKIEALISAGAFDDLASNRAELLANSEAWIKTITKEIERKEKIGSGIFGFFSNPIKNNLNKTESTLRVYGYNPYAISTTLIPKNSEVKDLLMGIQLKKTKAWTLTKHLEAEKEYLGLCLSAEPSDLMKDDIEAIRTIAINDAYLHINVTDDFNKFKKKSVILCGIISDKFEKKNKDNELFASYKIEDGTGNIEISIFPDQYGALEYKFNSGDAIWAEVSLKKGIEEGTVRGTVKAIGNIEEKRLKAVKKIVIQMNEAFFDDENNSKKIIDLLIQNKGDNLLFCEIYCKNKATLILNLANHSIKCSDKFIQIIEETWPGEIKVKRVYTKYHSFI